MVKKNNEIENKIEQENKIKKDENNNNLPSFFFEKTKIGPETKEEEISVIAMIIKIIIILKIKAKI